MPSVHTYTSKAKWEEIKKGYRKVKMSKQHEQWRMKEILHCEISHCGAKFSALLSLLLLSLLLLFLSF